MNRNSAFGASFHCLLVSFFSVFGAILGFTAFFVFFALFQGSDYIPKSHFAVEIQPNSLGVREYAGATTPVILHLDISGVIGAEKLTGDLIRSLLVESREGVLKDDRVKGILLVINSPGGTVTDADAIYRALLAYKEQYKVPIYAYIDGLCASGGFYIACAADKVETNSTSLIGSVGVLIPPFFNVAKLLDKVGIESMTLFAGKGKDELNPTRPWKTGEEKPLQSIVDGYYTHFVDLVAQHRPRLSKEKLIGSYGAQVFLAPLAEEYGYIDSSASSYNQTLETLVHEAKIEGKYQVVSLTRSTWINSLFDNEYLSLFNNSSTSLLNQLSLFNQFLYLYIP